MANLNLNINTYEDLQSLVNDESMFPFGTTCDVTPADLLAGNFEVAHFERPPFPTSDGKMIDVSYSGPVIETEPDARAEYADALRKLKWD